MKCIHQRVEKRLMRLLLDADNRGDRRRDEAGVSHGRQLDEPDTVGKVADERDGHLNRQARLATAAGTGEGQEAIRGQQDFDIEHVLAPPNEGGEMCR
jgi:hypothetical protein